VGRLLSAFVETYKSGGTGRRLLQETILAILGQLTQKRLPRRRRNVKRIRPNSKRKRDRGSVKENENPQSLSKEDEFPPWGTALYQLKEKRESKEREGVGRPLPKGVGGPQFLRLTLETWAAQG